ncbi:MAG: PKD domain-containing protein [Bacteroidota bacterium]
MIRKYRTFFAVFTVLLVFVIACEEFNPPESEAGIFEASVSSTDVTVGQAVVFADNSTEVSSRTWTFEGSSISTSSDRTVTLKYASTGTFAASVQVQFKDGSSDSEDFSITVSAESTSVSAAFSANVTQIGEAEQIIFTDESVGNADSYLWTFDGGEPATATIRSPTVTYPKFGRYDVTLQVTRSSDNGTSTELKSDFITVVQEDVVASFSQSATEVPEGLSIMFTNTSTNSPDQFMWTFEGGTPGTSTEENPEVFYETPGVYDVSFTATRVFDNSTSTVTTPDAVTVTEVSTQVLTNVGSDWDFADGSGWTVVQGVDAENVEFITADGAGESVMRVKVSQGGNMAAGGIISSNLIPSIPQGDYNIGIRFRNTLGGAESFGGPLEIRCYIQDHATFTQAPGGAGAEGAQQIIGIFKLGGISTTNLTTWSTSEFMNSDAEGDFADTDEWVLVTFKLSTNQELTDRAFKFQVRIGDQHAASSDAAFEIDYVDWQPVE